MNTGNIGGCKIVMEYTEVLDKQITRKQHYIPKAYLKNFSVSNQKPEHVYVVFSNDENAKTVSIDNICCRSYLYDQIAIDPDSKAHVFAAPNEIENSFIELEGAYATIVSKIKKAIRDSDEFELAQVEIDKLRQFMSSLLFRSPVFVHLSNHIIDTQYKNDPDHIKYVKDVLPNIPQNVFLSVLATEFWKKNFAPDVGLFPQAFARTMKESQLCIFKAQCSTFITSDMPVVNIRGEEDGTKYNLIGMPITPEIFLAFVDTAQRIPRIIIMNDNCVKRINRKQINKGMLISSRKDLLSHIDFSIDAEKEDDEQFYQLFHTDKETTLKQYEDMMGSKEIKFWR